MRLHPSWPLGPGWAIPCLQDYIDVRGHILPPPDVTTTNLYLLFVYSKDQTNNITWMYTPECPNFDLQLECHRNLPLLSVTAPLEWDDQMLLVLVLFQQTSKASETIYQCSRKAYDFCEADNKYVLPQFEAKWHKSRYFSVSNAWKFYFWSFDSVSANHISQLVSFLFGKLPTFNFRRKVFVFVKTSLWSSERWDETGYQPSY